jgi:hypothetical protein
MELKIFIYMTVTFLIALCAGYFMYYKLTIEPDKKKKKFN